jgi:hypothetical protein
LMAVVVLPTPPFWLVIAMMRPIALQEKTELKSLERGGAGRQ